MWWVLNPLLLVAVYYLMFGVILKISRGTENYVSYLLSGMFVFYYTRSAMVGAVNSILSNTKLLANLRFPRLVLPFSALFESAVGFMGALGVYFLIVGPMDGTWPTTAVVWLVPAFAIHTVFNFGLAALVARVAVPFRDVNNLVPYFIRLWLYVSPIIYPASFLQDVGSGLRITLELNPLFPILTMYRHALMERSLPIEDVGLSLMWAVLFFLVGVGVFVRNETRMTRYL